MDYNFIGMEPQAPPMLPGSGGGMLTGPLPLTPNTPQRFPPELLGAQTSQICK